MIIMDNQNYTLGNTTVFSLQGSLAVSTFASNNQQQQNASDNHFPHCDPIVLV